MVFAAFGQLVASQSGLLDLAFTLYRTMAGFAISVMIGLPAGLVLGHSKLLYNALEPIVDFVRSVPVTALFPLFLLFFAGGDFSKIAVAAFGGSLLIIINVMYGVRHSGKSRKLVAQTLGANEYLILRKVEFFESLPYLFGSLRLVISLVLVIVIVTEMLLGFSDYGLGLRIYDAYQVRHLAEMYASILLSGIVGYALNIGVKVAEKRVIHWTGK
jgi:ABC-type nitrate/sulfonate/bicarbonate transport system permease component